MTAVLDLAIGEIVDARLRAFEDRLTAKLPDLLDAALERRAADRWMSQSEVAEYLGLTPKTLWARLNRKKGSELLGLAETGVDGKKLWKKSDLEGWIKRRGTR